MTRNPSVGILLDASERDKSRTDVTVAAGPVQRIRGVLMPGVLHEDQAVELLAVMADRQAASTAPYKRRRRAAEGA